MPRDLVPIKVKIGLRDNGEADHPDFNLLPSTGDKIGVIISTQRVWVGTMIK